MGIVDEALKIRKPVRATILTAKSLAIIIEAFKSTKSKELPNLQNWNDIKDYLICNFNKHFADIQSIVWKIKTKQWNLESLKRLEKLIEEDTYVK